jgi:hypothetical protein
MKTVRRLNISIDALQRDNMDASDVEDKDVEITRLPFRAFLKGFETELGHNSLRIKRKAIEFMYTTVLKTPTEAKLADVVEAVILLLKLTCNDKRILPGVIEDIRERVKNKWLYNPTTHKKEAPKPKMLVEESDEHKLVMHLVNQGVGVRDIADIVNYVRDDKI